MKYTYRFVSGESVGIEVSAELEALLKNEDRLEYNNDHANTRRHVHLDTKKLDMGASQVQAEMDIALELLQKCVMENAHTALDQEDYQQRYDRYSERYNSARFRLAEINEQRQSTAIRKVKAVTFLDILEKGDGLIQDFNPSMWYTLVERVTILSNTQLRFHLHSGLHVQIGS